MLRVLIAPSGYKESLNAEDVCSAIAAGVRRGCPTANIVEMPLADGGEGTASTMARITGGTVHEVMVTGPLGVPIPSHFALLGGETGPTAVVELAAAAGLRLVPPQQRSPLTTTTRGVGELIRAALDAGAKRVLVGCGDSGVNDGGAGLAQALGVRMLTKTGGDIVPGGLGLAQLAHVDLDDRDHRMSDVAIEVACNIENVLLGPGGVARIFGPQKGASASEVAQLEAALENYAEILRRDLGIDVSAIRGGGASGGAGAGLHALLGARLRSRFDVLFPYFPLDAELALADIVITAEGGVDFKTARGKIPAEIGVRGRALGKPVFVLAGTVGEGAETVLDYGVCAYFSTVGKPQTLEEAIARAKEEIPLVAEHMIRVFLAGTAMARQIG